MTPPLKGISVAMLSMCLAYAGSLQAENVYRYVDEDGEVHYSATLPPEYSDRPYEVINSAGIVVERVDPTAPEPTVTVEEKDEPEPIYTEEEIRLQSDRLLVLKYHSEDEIFEAMEVEVANLGYDARILDQTRASDLKSLAEQVREAANRQRAGLPEEADRTEQVRRLQGRLKSNAESRIRLQAREEQIRAGFMAELERYRYLQSGGQPGGT